MAKKRVKKKDLETKWMERYGNPVIWEKRAHRGKIGFGLFLLLVGVVWLLRDMGYIPELPIAPLVIIFFSLFILLKKL